MCNARLRRKQPGWIEKTATFSRLFHTARPIIIQRMIVMRIHLAALAALSILFVGTNALAQGRSADKTPATMSEEHLSLGQYFDQLASRERALAQSYERMASFYREKAPPAGVDATSAAEMCQQYKQLAEIDSKVAKTAEDLAVYYRRQAKQMRNYAFSGDSAFRR